MIDSPAIAGSCDGSFARVRAAFQANFAERSELGAALAVYVDGRLVVDLWGGVANHVTRAPWVEDTLTLVFSATKGATALCAHLLAARGALDLDAPVARYWPEFAQSGKERIAVRQLLNHQAGLAAIDRALPPESVSEWDTLCAALAQQAPNWPPGDGHGYHAMTFGWLVGEVVRRVSGRTLGRFFQDEIAAPLGLDCWIGLPAQHEARVSRVRMAPPSQNSSKLLRAMFDRESLTARAFLNPRSMLMPGSANSPALHAIEIPAANGITTARSLARLYALCAEGGSLDGSELLDRDTLAPLAHAESEGADRVLLLPTRFTGGYMKSVDNRPDSSLRMGPNDSTFGHPGAGGSIGMADPTARVALGYVMNQLGHGVLINERGQALIDAVYDSL